MQTEEPAMNKHMVRWKKTRTVSVHGSDVEVEAARFIEAAKMGLLLEQIRLMPRKKTVSLETALKVMLLRQDEAFAASRFGEGPGQHSWYEKNFVEWISSLGYHIELTGDEFELWSAPKEL